MADKQLLSRQNQKRKEEDGISMGRQRALPNKCGKMAKTYNSRYSLVVTHPTTNLPI